ncbi:MAG: superoxide dismutase [Cu-Zn] SodC [Usitatibacter sp.]
MRSACKLLQLFAFAAGAAGADYTVGMNAIDIKGVGATLGDVKISAAPGGGVVFTPNLKGLPPGEHGMHVHEFPNCGPKVKDGKLTAGEMAGGHWDPEKVHKHGSPAGGGHEGDLPVLKVAADGTATQAVTAPRLKLSDLRRKSLMIHAGPDTYSDQPAPNDSGGERIACGVIETGPR